MRRSSIRTAWGKLKYVLDYFRSFAGFICLSDRPRRGAAFRQTRNPLCLVRRGSRHRRAARSIRRYDMYRVSYRSARYRCAGTPSVGTAILGRLPKIRCRPCRADRFSWRAVVELDHSGWAKQQGNAATCKTTLDVPISWQDCGCKTHRAEPGDRHALRPRADGNQDGGGCCGAGSGQPNALVLVYSGNLHAKKGRWKTQDGVGYGLAASHLAQDTTITVDLFGYSGQAWTCQADGCGVHSYQGVEGIRVPGFVLGQGPAGFDAIGYTGVATTASPPAIPPSLASLLSNH